VWVNFARSLLPPIFRYPVNEPSNSKVVSARLRRSHLALTDSSGQRTIPSAAQGIIRPSSQRFGCHRARRFESSGGGQSGVGKQRRLPRRHRVHYAADEPRKLTDLGSCAPNSLFEI